MIELPSEKVLFIVSLVSVLFFIIGIVFFISQSMYVKNRIQAERETNQRLIDTQEDERYRIASDLHDNMGIKYTSTRLFADNVNQCLREMHDCMHDPVLLQEKISEAQMLIGKVLDGNTQAYQSLRQTIYAITPFKLEELGLIGSLQELLNQQVPSHIRFEFVHNNTHLNFGKNFQISVYRIIQELLNNTLKHAQASSIQLSIHFDDVRMKMVYEDDGKGISNLSKHHAGFGMQTLQLRSSQFKGTVKLQTNEPKGVRYTFTFLNSELKV